MRTIDYDNLSAADVAWLQDRPWLQQPDNDDDIIDDGYESMSVPELKALCQERDLPAGGKKAELIVRLTEWDDENSTGDEG